jgi:hypothetical protein
MRQFLALWALRSLHGARKFCTDGVSGMALPSTGFHTNYNSNLRVAACLPFGKTCYFVNNGCAALNWNPYQTAVFFIRPFSSLGRLLHPAARLHQRDPHQSLSSFESMILCSISGEMSLSDVTVRLARAVSLAVWPVLIKPTHAMSAAFAAATPA